jgi:hypothetical protein
VAVDVPRRFAELGELDDRHAGRGQRLHAWQSATNSVGSRQAITTRGIPAAMISAVHGGGGDRRSVQGSSVL